MNKSNLKSYAPQARKDFIAAVTARANLLCLSSKAGNCLAISKIRFLTSAGDKPASSANCAQ